MFHAKKLIVSAAITLVATSAMAATPGQYTISNSGSVQCTTTNAKIHPCSNNNPFSNANFSVTTDGNSLIINNVTGLSSAVVVPLNTAVPYTFCARVDGSLLPACSYVFSEQVFTVQTSTTNQGMISFNQLSDEDRITGMIPSILNGNTKTTITGMTLSATQQ